MLQMSQFNTRNTVTFICAPLFRCVVAGSTGPLVRFTNRLFPWQLFFLSASAAACARPGLWVSSPRLGTEELAALLSHSSGNDNLGQCRVSWGQQQSRRWPAWAMPTLIYPCHWDLGTQFCHIGCLLDSPKLSPMVPILGVFKMSVWLKCLKLIRNKSKIRCWASLAWLLWPSKSHRWACAEWSLVTAIVVVI